MVVYQMLKIESNHNKKCEFLKNTLDECFTSQVP